MTSRGVAGAPRFAGLGQDASPRCFLMPNAKWWCGSPVLERLAVRVVDSLWATRAEAKYSHLIQFKVGSGAYTVIRSPYG